MKLHGYKLMKKGFIKQRKGKRFKSSMKTKLLFRLAGIYTNETEQKTMVRADLQSTQLNKTDSVTKGFVGLL